MDTVTYPDPRVPGTIAGSFVPVKVNMKGQPDRAKEVGAFWTPTFQFRAADGRLARSTSGYLPPDAFLTELAIGRAQVAMLEGRFADAEAALREAVSQMPESVQTPEAYYWLGVARYKASGKPEGLVETWNQLLDRYPQTTCAVRASFVRGPRAGTAEKQRTG